MTNMNTNTVSTHETYYLYHSIVLCNYIKQIHKNVWPSTDSTKHNICIEITILFCMTNIPYLLKQLFKLPVNSTCDLVLFPG
uniref:Uncharacterized protein n=1 Tax=Octopus bimaculoides TaxID=37653 RepID=A0A0L8FHA4_OCTBM